MSEFYHIFIFFCMHHHTLPRHKKIKLKSGRDANGKTREKIIMMIKLSVWMAQKWGEKNAEKFN